MATSNSSFRVQTVLGPVDSESLGIALPHEHILVDAGTYFIEPEDPEEIELANQPVTLENLSWVRTHRFNNADGLRQTDTKIAIKELLLFKKAGGKTVVDVSNIGLGRNPRGLVEVAQATGLNLVMGAGYYIEPSHPDYLDSMTDKEICRRIVKEITTGVDDTGVRAGVIGEIGCSFPLKDGERKVLAASAAAQKQTGVALIIHPPGSAREVIEEILHIVKNNGGDLRKTAICHIDIMWFSLETIRLVAEAGCFVELDTFGHLMVPSVFQGRVMEFPSESQRISLVKQLIDERLLDHILLSQDTFLKELLTSYGGFGYAHLVENILPVMRAKGISEDQINAMIVDNPRRLLEC